MESLFLVSANREPGFDCSPPSPTLRRGASTLANTLLGRFNPTAVGLRIVRRSLHQFYKPHLVETNALISNAPDNVQEENANVSIYAGVIGLQEASLCLDCEAISGALNQCLACGSHALLSIARALNQTGAKQDSDHKTPKPNRHRQTRLAQRGDFLHCT
jgi:hypothetical protein